jgi:hypothetical protein
MWTTKIKDPMMRTRDSGIDEWLLHASDSLAWGQFRGIKEYPSNKTFRLSHWILHNRQHKKFVETMQAKIMKNWFCSSLSGVVSGSTAKCYSGTAELSGEGCVSAATGSDYCLMYAARGCENSVYWRHQSNGARYVLYGQFANRITFNSSKNQPAADPTKSLPPNRIKVVPHPAHPKN